jgi:hypothetical protein
MEWVGRKMGVGAGAGRILEKLEKSTSSPNKLPGP